MAIRRTVKQIKPNSNKVPVSKPKASYATPPKSDPKKPPAQSPTIHRLYTIPLL